MFDEQKFYDLYDDIKNKRKSIDDLSISEIIVINNMLIEEIDEKLAKIQDNLRGPAKSFLEEQWDEIQGNLNILKNEPYIDDQVELDFIWDICENLIQSDKLKEETWETRKQILSEIIRNAFYEEYSVYDPIHDLFLALTFTTEEKIWCAETIFKTGPSYIHGEGARIYKENGKQEKYYEYLETKLAKKSKYYIELIDYYKESDRERAVNIAEAAMEKCTDDLTEVAVFLLKDALMRNDEDKYKRLMKSAKLRKTINYESVVKAIDVLQA